jgi:hypothetical protein
LTRWEPWPRKKKDSAINRFLAVPSVSNVDKGLRFALISDTGGPAASGTTFYYNIGSAGKGFKPTNSFGPGPQAVSRLVQSWQPDELLAIGDLSYNVGGSTLQDISIGQYYNNFVYPYPPLTYLGEPYLSINGAAVGAGKKSWPYNIYNYPVGFPDPLTGGLGGSPDQRNHFWGALGNHDYGMAVGYGQVGVTPYQIDGTPNGQPVGPSSTTSVEAAIDYFLPYLENPSLLGEDQARLNVGAVDPSGNRGAYYSITFGGSVEKPLVEFFNLDTERLNVNAGFEDWNPSGMKVLTKVPNPETGIYEDKYVNQVASKENDSLHYDPSSPTSAALAGTTNDPDNGYDQFIWLKNSLEKSKATWKIINGHHPVYASGRWKDTQPDDHMSNVYLQRLLNALPEGSFDAYYNGHDHFYERVLESKQGGIGLGIPYITNGNSGRNLEKKIQVYYGVSVYEPTEYDGSNPDEVENKKGNPNEDALKYLLDSAPLEVGASGLSGSGDSQEREGFANGFYGYGFGATKLDLDEGYLLFHYQEAPITDPAIANHLSDGVAPEAGFADTIAADWIPNPDGDFSGKSDLARFSLSITNGIVTGVTLLNGGRGYMRTKAGTHTVEGFNIYGNNIDPLIPWMGTAQVDLSFVDGSLNAVSLTDGGSGYELAVQAAADDNTATSTNELADKNSIVVAIDFNLDEVQYLVRDTEIYHDWYLISDSGIQSQAINSGAFGGLQVSVAPSSSKAQEVLATMPITTGYSGTGAQRAYIAPQQGLLRVSDSNSTVIAGGASLALQDGLTSLAFSSRPAPGALTVDFGGDPLSSYQVNFREASTAIDVTYGSWTSGITAPSPRTLNFGQDVALSLVRTDATVGPVSLGLQRSGALSPSLLIKDAEAASSSALNTNSIFIPSGSASWLATESQRLGSSSASLGLIEAGEWTPVAFNQAGEQLAVESITIAGNGIAVSFQGGIEALYNTAGTGSAQSLPSDSHLVVTVQRLGQHTNGLAFYKADPITGAVTVADKSILPADSGYLQAALAAAKGDGLLLGPERLPEYGMEMVISDLALDPSLNYGLLLLRKNNERDIVSSYSQANAGNAVSMVSFIAPDRGIVYGMEDLPSGKSDFDYNDLIVGVASSAFALLA